MDDNFGLKDSGNRRGFGTGSVRDTDDGKPRFDFFSPWAALRFAIHMTKGALKYGERNWEKGQPVTVLVASLFRHLYAFIRGERDEDHLAALLFGVQAIIHFEELAKQGDPVALNMLDGYASKVLADQLRMAQEVAYIQRGAEQAADLKEELRADVRAILASNGGAYEVARQVVESARSNEEAWLIWAAEGDHAVLNPDALLPRGIPNNDFLDNAQYRA